MKRYEQLPHTADIAIKAYGQTLEELFSNVSYGMFDIMSDLSGVEDGENITIEAEGPDEETLLISLLNEFLYICFEKEMLFFDFDVVFPADTRVRTKARGISSSGRMRTEIKAATYHDCDIIKTDEGYEVTIVFDV